MQLIHISDLHVGRSDNNGAFGALAAHMISQWGDAAEKPVVVLTGDIADDGERWQFQQAADTLSLLRQAGFKVLTCPGNHDLGWNGINAKSKNLAIYQRYIEGGVVDYPTVERIGHCVFLGLNSMAAETDWLDGLAAEGELGSRQIKALDIELCRIDLERAKNPDLRAVVFLHHHPFYYNNFLALKDADALKAVIGRLEVPGRVDVLMFGHKHAAEALPDKAVKYNIGLISASHKSTDIVKGVGGIAAYRYRLLDTGSLTTQIIEFAA